MRLGAWASETFTIDSQDLAPGLPVGPACSSPSPGSWLPLTAQRAGAIQKGGAWTPVLRWKEARSAGLSGQTSSTRAGLWEDSEGTERPPRGRVPAAAPRELCRKESRSKDLRLPPSSGGLCLCVSGPPWLALQLTWTRRPHPGVSEGWAVEEHLLNQECGQQVSTRISCLLTCSD